MLCFCYIAERLGNFHIGVTSADPKAVVPSVSNYPLCAAYPGIIGSGATADVTCNPGVAGRYVIVQLKALTYLTLCEVQVFTGTGTSNKIY